MTEAFGERSHSVPDRTAGTLEPLPPDTVDTVSPVRHVLVAGVLALALAGCSGGSSTSSAPTTTPAPAPSTAPGAAPAPASSASPASTATTEPCAGFRGGTAPAQSAGRRVAGLLTDAEAGTAGCLDEVTFSFQSLGDGTPPGYVVQYEDPPFSDGDPPDTVPLDGNAFLSVTMTPAASVDVTQPDHPATYLGGLLLQYGDHHHLVEVRKFDDALGSVRWVIALDGKRPFIVDSAMNPTRITVYIG